MKVLIADQNDAKRQQLKSLLAGWRYEAVEACDGERCRQLMAAPGAPRIAVLSLELPFPGALEISRTLKNRPEGPLTYVILLADDSSRADRQEALAAGAHCLLPRPFFPEELLSQLQVAEHLIRSDERVREIQSRLDRSKKADPVTGLPNRAHFIELGNRELQRALRYERGLAVLKLSLEDIMQIRGRLGSSVADESLKAMIIACNVALRDSDLMGRTGETEFAALLPETDHETAALVADRLKRSLKAMVVIADQQQLHMHITICIATARAGDSTIADLLNRAE